MEISLPLSITNTIIKISSSIIAPSFTSIYNESINTGFVPNVLKISRITPIYNNGNWSKQFSTNIETIVMCKGARTFNMQPAWMFSY
jgi:3-isopropylmalate dehydratase small subunit